MYSLHVVRLGRWANETTPLRLVAYKATAELVLSLIFLSFLVFIAADISMSGTQSSLWSFCQEWGREIVLFFQTIQDRIDTGTLPASSVQKAALATLWTGLVSTAYTTYAQSFGQRRVKPADANLIYSLQPIFTAVFAFLLLGETMGEWGFVGGALVGAAVYLAASKSLPMIKSEE